MADARFQFTVSATDGKARTGSIAMHRGVIRTPAFMPVGTAASVKAIKPESVAATGADIILGNTYHLMLRPGAERVARLGGLHKFMNWDRPILTDSGGYQVFSLAEQRTITDHGATFKSHLDGSPLELTPERAVEIQQNLGSDIAMVLDECPPADGEPAVVRNAVRRSLLWAQHRRNFASCKFSRQARATASPQPSILVKSATPEQMARMRWSRFSRLRRVMGLSLFT